MKSHRSVYLAGFLLILLMAGCRPKDEEYKKGPFLFYINGEGTGLVREEYVMEGEDPEKAVQTMLDKLSEPPESVDIKSAFPNGVEAVGFVLDKNKLHLYMNEKYSETDEVEEVLLRAALVQSLTQIPGVEMVDIYVGEKPLTAKNGQLIGYMGKDSFVRNTGTALKSLQKATLTLFFADKSGEKLVSEKVDVRFFGNVSMEKRIVEQLIKGPQTNDLKPVLSPDTKILSVSVKDGICYVNFDEKFLTHSYEAKPEIVIHGIVDSIISNCSVSRVQIAVEGESAVKFQGSISLAEPFDRSIELVEHE